MSAPNFGILQRSDLMSQGLLLRDIGEDRLWQYLDYQLSAYNAVMKELTSLLTFETERPITRFGAGGRMYMLPADEFSRPDAQKLSPGYQLGFPITQYQIGLGWTREYFRRRPAKEWAEEVDSMTGADEAMQIDNIRSALFNPTNSTFHDPDFGDLAVKALLNADSLFIPGYNGVTFNPASHTHYLVSGNTSPTLANLQAMKLHVTEHGHRGQLVLYINDAQDPAIRALTGFVAKQQIGIVDPLGKFAVVQDENAIGRIEDMEVRVRNWVPAAYMFVFNEYGPNSNQNPLARRISPFPEDNDLRIVATTDTADKFPLTAEYAERWFGVAAKNRSNGVVMQIKASGSYDIPTLGAVA